MPRVTPNSRPTAISATASALRPGQWMTGMPAAVAPAMSTLLGSPRVDATARNGRSNNFNFEGTDLFNFGSNSVAGLNYLTVAVGARYKVFEWLQFGGAAELPLAPGASSRDINRFRLTFDVIFRY